MLDTWVCRDSQEECLLTPGCEMWTYLGEVYIVGEQVWFYILTTYVVQSERVPSCACVH